MVGFVDTHDNMKNFDQKFAGKDPGPYVGKVKFTNDPLRQGRLGVNIPDLSQTNDPGPDDCIWCQYLSPFYGAKSIEANDKSDPDSYKGTQHTYGMWFVPPDIDTEVLVIFAKGELSKKNAFWIGCVQQPLTNHQVPGYGSSNDTIRSNQDAQDLAKSGDTNYGTDFLPVGEKNRKMIEEAQTAAFANSLQYPINDGLADQLLEQGLIQDTVRGTTSSSARREAPSQVFGINTPGRIQDDSRRKNIGPEGAEVRPDRNSGHSFVMDDGDEEGENQLIRLRTASGHQLLMHDTEGVVYIANGSGKAFIEMNADGKVSIYATDGISMRTEGDFNLHSDRNIQFHAKEKIKFTAEEDVVLNAEKYIYAMGQSGILNASHKGSVRHYAKDGITSFTDGPQLHGAKGRIDLAGSQVHFNSVPARATWGPSWMKPDHDKIQIIAKEGEIDIEAYGPIDEGKPSKLENRTTVRDTTIGRGDFVNNDDPNYKQPPSYGSTDRGYGGREFYNAWDELEAFIGPNGDNIQNAETISSVSLDTRLRLLINELGVVTPFHDKKNGVGNMAEKKAEYFKGVKERQKVGLPDAVGGVFVTHEPWNRGVKPVKRIKDPQFDPYNKSPSLGLGDFDNEWLEWEALNNKDYYTNEQWERQNELTEKLGIQTGTNYTGAGSYGSNVAEAKANYYEGLKERQKEYENLSVSEQNEILGQNN